MSVVAYRNHEGIPLGFVVISSCSWGGMSEGDWGGRKVIKWFFIQIAGLFRVRVMVHSWDTERVCGSAIVHYQIT